jgi:hypothetical protein
VLLDRLLAALLRYVVFPTPQSADAVVLWIAATYAQTAFDAAPRLNITGPEKRCGKSRLLDMVEATCHEPFVTADSSVAAVFRSIGTNPPTLIFDEVDAIFKVKDGNEDLRALLNAGFQRNRPSRRCVGALQEVKAFPTFAMAALAGIGDLPDTITDRSVIVRMRRRAPGEEVAQYRMLRHRAPLRTLGDQVGAWVRSILAQLREAEPEMPVEDRAADVWEPLVILADAAGGTWPKRARAAALAMTQEGQESATEQSLGVRLLADCRAVFATGVEEIGSEELVNKLRANPEAPWETFAFTQRNLANKLKPYGITPRHVRPGGFTQCRGYRAADFRDAFARYLPDSAREASQSVTASFSQLSPGTDRTGGTHRSVTTARTPHRDASAEPPWDQPGYTGADAAGTDRSVTGTASVPGLSWEKDAVTDWDGSGAASGHGELCALCGERMDRIYFAAGAHPWCLDGEPP